MQVQKCQKRCVLDSGFKFQYIPPRHPAPRSPYPKDDGILRVRFPPVETQAESLSTCFT